MIKRVTFVFITEEYMIRKCKNQNAKKEEWTGNRGVFNTPEKKRHDISCLYIHLGNNNLHPVFVSGWAVDRRNFTASDSQIDG